MNKRIHCRRYIRHTVSAALATVCLASNAQSVSRVYVSGTTEDSVGRQIVFSVKESIRRSAGLSLAESEADSRIQVQLVTLDPDAPDGSRRTIYSAVWTVRTLHQTPVTMYLTQFVGICGQNRVAGCAQNLVAITDEQVSKVRSWTK